MTAKSKTSVLLSWPSVYQLSWATCWYLSNACSIVKWFAGHSWLTTVTTTKKKKDTCSHLFWIQITSAFLFVCSRTRRFLTRELFLFLKRTESIEICLPDANAPISKFQHSSWIVNEENTFSSLALRIQNAFLFFLLSWGSPSPTLPPSLCGTRPTSKRWAWEAKMFL